ncbi:MAG: hypothetical protein P8L46_14570 [Acidimicrobiales bacterium]|nr:hypothetical protein [Acidimicrobiales bacterium]MDG2219258.1 hypothetical protein [Acidimicrobiales bacterium]
MGHLTTAELEARLGEVRESPADGGPHPDMQLNIINARFLEMVAQSEERMPLAGDQLVVDLDISEANLPAWSKLSIGDAVMR